MATMLYDLSTVDEKFENDLQLRILNYLSEQNKGVSIQQIVEYISNMSCPDRKVVYTVLQLLRKHQIELSEDSELILANRRQ